MLHVMYPKCYENFQNFCKEAASLTWKKEGNNYACMLSFPRSPHLTSTSILYIVEGSYKETPLTFYQQSQTDAERILLMSSILMILQFQLRRTIYFLKTRMKVMLLEHL
jgi:hypothetical protein